MNRCVGCDNVERSLDADLLCSWCVERRECFRKGEQAGAARAFRECAEEARRVAAERKAYADRSYRPGPATYGETSGLAAEEALNDLATWAESKAGTT